MYSTLCTQHKIFSKERKKEERRRRKKWGKVEEERARRRGLWEDDGEGLMLEARGSIEAVLTLHPCLVFFFFFGQMMREEKMRVKDSRGRCGGVANVVCFGGAARPHIGEEERQNFIRRVKEEGMEEMFFYFAATCFFGLLLSLLLFFISCLRKHGLLFKYYKPY